MKKDLFEQVYSYYYQSLFLYAYSLTQNKEDAEDLVANAFVKAFFSYKDGNLKAWLYVVLKNEYYTLYKKKKRFVDEGKIELENFADKQDVFKEIIDNEKKEWLYRKIYQLEEKEREVILLSIESELKDQEIAEIMDISIDNVRVLRHRVKKKLIEMCKMEGYL